MKTENAVNRYPRSAGAVLVQRSGAAVLESPGFTYMAGLGLGAGCGALVLLLLLGMLGL